LSCFPNSELISNASDALEQVRHRTVSGEGVLNPDTELAIHLTTDEAAGTFTISDSGIGLDREELVKNLGTIARSGTKAFVERTQASGELDSGAASNVIGQFGVGFYSAFMVSDEVSVYSRSADPERGDSSVWRSAG
jgi:HSP90 family molecular chaperone